MVAIPLPPGYRQMTQDSLLGRAKTAVAKAKEDEKKKQVTAKSTSLMQNIGKDLYIPDPNQAGGYIRNPSVLIPEGDFEDAVRSLETTASPFTPGASTLPRLTPAEFAQREAVSRIQADRRRRRQEQVTQTKMLMQRRRGRRGLMAPEQQGGGLGFLTRYFA